MGDPIRVLHVIAGMGSGGAEAFLMNMFRHIDRSKVQFDFLLRSEDNFYKDELERGESKVYYTASFPRHILKNYIQVKKILKKNTYDIIHVHANALFYLTAILEAKRQHVPCRIMHSHNTSSYYPSFQFVHNYFKKRIHALATHCFACSKEAGEWMFGDRYEVVHNAIELDAFRYREEARRKIRLELNIPEKSFVIGHVGRFIGAKNHVFLVDVFRRIAEIRNDSVLVLVGEGELEAAVRKQVSDYGLERKVIFAGTRKDIGDVMSAFDVFVFPSLFEGLALVAMEAQANGLPVISSCAVPSEAAITDRLHRVPLELGAESWAGVILNTDCSRTYTYNQLVQAGYEAGAAAKKLECFYLEQAQKRENVG